MKKLISVIIPTYNRQFKTIEAINSVYSISPELIEIIVVDDASLEPFACSNVNCNNIDVRVVRVENNGGAGLARKIGVENAQANIVAFLDSDDCYCSNWLDNVLKLIYKNHNLNLIIVGQVNGASRVHALVYQILMSAPKFLQLILTRLITVFFNPFYTPSLVMSKPNCSFHDSLRYCEDYYTFSRAVFKADKIYILQNNACIIGREPNTVGGLSDSRKKMYLGELMVRSEMLFLPSMNLFYKIFVPLGYLYQVVRISVKYFLTFLNGVFK